MRRAEMLLLKSLAETLMADRDNRHDDLQATMRLAHLSSPEMILYMVNRVLELEESIERIAAVLQKLSADEPMPLEETPPEPAFEPSLQSRATETAETYRRAGRYTSTWRVLAISAWTCRSTCSATGTSGPRPSGQGRFGVVPNSRQISGRSS